MSGCERSTARGKSPYSLPASSTPTATSAVPDVPSAPSLVAGDGEITVSWAAVTGVTGYEVYWDIQSSAASIPVGNKKIVTAGAACVITGLENGQTYYVWLKAKNSMGPSDFSVATSEIPRIAVTGVTLNSTTASIGKTESYQLTATLGAAQRDSSGECPGQVMRRASRRFPPAVS
ncbi:MAG: fibronectin type III domain-containing protein [Candidatus Moduliflexus flocculans]|nr:fibronectin type III domain-containing protein [Candidatus Moduliflexus flocculans]